MKECQQCGNCCRQSIIEDVFDLDLLREPKLKAVATEFKDEPGRYMLAAGGCPFLQDNQCSIYPTRPNMCVAYEPGQFCNEEFCNEESGASGPGCDGSQ